MHTNNEEAAKKKNSATKARIERLNENRRELRELDVNCKVAIRDPVTKTFAEHGTITEKLNDRSYKIDVDGTEKRRNRAAIRPLHLQDQHDLTSTHMNTMDTTEQDPNEPSNDEPHGNKEGSSKEPEKGMTFYQRTKAKRKADKAFYTENPRRSTRNS